MDYIDYIKWILNSDFLQNHNRADELTMIEPDNGIDKEQRVDIVNKSSSIDKMYLYCFNTPETGADRLFPFFNQRTVEPNKAPHGLNSFCDYILLVQHKKGLFVFFLEMKRGVKGDAAKQLEATTTFFDYVLKSAERIKSVNSFPDFDPKQVKYRKIIISEAHSNKKITKETKNKDIKCDMNAVFTHKCLDRFNPIGYCE